MNRKILLSIATISVILVVLALVKYYPDYSNSLVPTGTSSPASSVDSGQSLSASPNSASGVKSGDIPTNRLVPKCNLTGQIIYDEGAFIHIDGWEFNYNNANDPTDMIKWVINPAGEEFNIGPNRLSGLKRGSGGDFLTISFNGAVPKYSEYTLSASIDYVGLVNNEAKILNEKCSGRTILKIN
jgi:hypothetical protein